MEELSEKKIYKKKYFKQFKNKKKIFNKKKFYI